MRTSSCCVTLFTLIAVVFLAGCTVPGSSTSSTSGTGATAALVPSLTPPARASIGPIPTPCDLPGGDLVCSAIGDVAGDNHLHQLHHRG